MAPAAEESSSRSSAAPRSSCSRILCVVGPWFLRVTYQEQNLDLGAVAPSAAHWLGTDTLGRDFFVRLLYGGRISLGVGLCATFVALTIGVVYGAIAGYVGGKTDAVMMRARRHHLCPALHDLRDPADGLLRAEHHPALRGDRRRRVADHGAHRPRPDHGAEENGVHRGRPLARPEQHAASSSATCCPTPSVPIIVYTTLTIPGVMLLEAFLSFLGLGVQPPMSSWGTLIKDGAEKMEEFPWLLIFPGTIFSLTLFSLNFLGDGLRDALDVRAAKD